MSLHPKDPKITAYALGELSGDEAKAVERFLEGSAEGRMEVDAIRKFTGQLRAEFAAQPGAAPSSRKPATKIAFLAAASVAIALGVFAFLPENDNRAVAPAAVEGDDQPMRTVKVVMDPPSAKAVARGELREYKVDVGGRAASVPPEINRIQLYNVFWEHQPALSGCYNRERDKGPAPTGELQLSFEISKSGEPLNLKTTRNTLRNDALAACVEREVRGWSFPAPAAGNASRTILYPLIFVQE